MDEMLFRSSQKVENFQVYASLVASNAKQKIHETTEQGKSLIINSWNSSQSLQLQTMIRDFIDLLLDKSHHFKQECIRFLKTVNPGKLYDSILGAVTKRWTRRDVYFLCIGFVFGSFVGIFVGVLIRKKQPILRYMQAIQCTQYSGIEAVCVIDNAVAPCECGPDEIIINVEAASIHPIDVQICNGYGKTLRNILCRIYRNSKSDLPVTLGRDCAGIIVEMGANVKRLEVYDKVWLTVPFWDQGTLCRSLRVNESRVGRMPKSLSDFKKASSLPYAGIKALFVLEQLDITSENAENKRIFIHGGCTPVGCVLLQILSSWGAEVSTTCYERAVRVAEALGASEVIPLPETGKSNNKKSLNVENCEAVPKSLSKELELKDSFDFIIITTDCSLSVEELKSYCKNGEKVISTLPVRLSSDDCGTISKALLELYIKIQYLFERMFGISLNNCDEAHMCHMALDMLAEMVDRKDIQTVIDKIFDPYSIDVALAHIQSTESIGNTIITFR